MTVKRNICILTQPLFRNYGGLLQAYALQKVLKDLGHNVLTDTRPIKIYSWHHKLMNLFFQLGGRFFLKFPWFLKRLPFCSSEIMQIGKNTDEFIRKNISTIDFFEGNIFPSDAHLKMFNTYIVGSDQVWREDYSYIPNYFLDFLKNKNNIKRLAYAASFGITEWTYSKELTAQCCDLAKYFDLITVREDSAIDLCKRYLGVKAEHVLDPTMLLSKREYISLIEEDCTLDTPGELMVYLLDDSTSKETCIKKVSSVLNIRPFCIKPGNEFKKENRRNIEKMIYPKVTTWLKGFMDAEFVITDSFHGTVFAIIFNKPFISISNTERGKTRFESLLKMFNIENRLVTDLNNIDEILSQKIDFEKINSIMEQEREKALAIITNTLK